MSKNKILREALNSGSLFTAMAAHNPLAAKLAEQAGFGGIWGSGFELSASYAVPDANILSMGTHLDMMRAIASVVSVPLIADIDTVLAMPSTSVTSSRNTKQPAPRPS